MEEERCSKCGRKFYKSNYKKKGYNSKSLLNLRGIQDGYIRNENKRKAPAIKRVRCVIAGCTNKRVGKSLVCLQHYGIRSVTA